MSSDEKNPFPYLEDIDIELGRIGAPILPRDSYCSEAPYEPSTPGIEVTQLHPIPVREATQAQHGEAELLDNAVDESPRRDT